jgi:hypothetical protein
MRGEVEAFIDSLLTKVFSGSWPSRGYLMPDLAGTLHASSYRSGISSPNPAFRRTHALKESLCAYC